jgi:excisionase family DNA binding protein
MSLIPKTVYCTTRQAAEILGVSTRTAQLWVENGLLEAWKTGGGHRRINRVSVQRLLDSEARPRAIATPRGERLKVLVVEDDCVLLKLYKTVIAHWNLPLDVTTASNGVDGLIRVGRDAPDVMITDLAMPCLDGFHLIRSLASTSYREGMEIIVVSGLDVADIETRGALPIGIRVFSKPVPFAELHAVFTEILQRRAAYLSKETPWNP